MSFAVDTKLGPYKIISLIGAGGMGEVYKAHDTRLLRDVALKVLQESFTADPDRLRRFEQEARAIAALNHPNIVSVFDVGVSENVQYIVTELIEGQTLRQRISPQGIPTRKAVELGIQLANGLAAAHDQGIAHRDLKPENIVVTKDGRLKILDFGLAKLRRSHAQTETLDGVTAAETNAGMVLGTVGYMAPEQVRGEPADNLSDIFSFGSILYEMLSGQRAFKRNTNAETMTAILNEEPQEISSRIGMIAPALERIVRHCMEKQPRQRFQSARDIAFDLESVSAISGTSSVTASGAIQTRARWIRPAILALAPLAAGLGLGMWVVRPAALELHPKLRRVTFSRLTVLNARFTPDGNLIYGASLEGRPAELYFAQKGSVESRPFGIPSTSILSVARSGELAVQSNPILLEGFEYSGMLARAPQGGGAPRAIAGEVEFADWSPDGSTLAVVRRVAGKVRLEYPLGKVLYETAGWISHPRISPDGSHVAFIDHPYSRDDGGAVALIDKAGNTKRLTTSAFVSAQGLAWQPNGSEIWFTATTSGSSRELHAVTPGGKERLVYLGTGTLTLHDISTDGRVLFSRDDWRSGIAGAGPDGKERDLSWHDWTVARDISDDGHLVSFDETGEAGEDTGAFYVRGSDGSPAVRLGEGVSPSLSRDGKRVLAMVPGPNGRRNLVEIPTGAGESRSISTGEVQVHGASLFPDGRRILEFGSAVGRRGLQLWVQDLEKGVPRAISPEGVDTRLSGVISPDGKRVVAVDPQGKLVIYPVEGGAPEVIPGVQGGDRPLRWTADGKTLLVAAVESPNVIFDLDLATGKRKLFRTMPVPDGLRPQDVSSPIFAPDLKSYVYSYTRITSDLYVVDGLK